ncbi:hypothetical protein [Emticicia sp. BO119]|uniref:hypothetical protein n=1 Tax=Emticicia sp. BO119 TaxID=2757768 RepID=UPI0015F0B79B|nr:hypothetical protein [Emticicia sp. BO119]MBA4850234.1 hypothetical protein [Emticicia sp. BO119]
MSFKFVTLYGIVVILTSLFFQFVPLPKMLAWEELLLSKLLNQAPVLLCMGYLWVQRKRIKNPDIFYLVMMFLFLNVFSEIYYYSVNAESLLAVNIFNNSLIYTVLLTLLIKQRVKLRDQVVNVKNISYATFTGVLFVIGFSFSLLKVYQEYYVSNKLFFFIVLLAMVITTISVCMSFFVDKAFSKNWYKIILGTIAIAVLDIYVYLSLFVFATYTAFLYTIGKLVFSIGLLLIVDISMRKCLNKTYLAVAYKRVSKTP